MQSEAHVNGHLNCHVIGVRIFPGLEENSVILLSSYWFLVIYNEVYIEAAS